ncbi:PilZ domain-containing protein [bacterium]|nr:PilZ domain-containing protein [bacterium]
MDTCDISGGGMLVAAAKPIEPETIVRVSMLVGPDGPAKPVHLLARVVRTERAFPPDAKHPWRVAIHFEDIEDEDRETIVKHVIATQRLSVRRVIDRRSANGRAACCFGFYRIDAKRIGGPSKK